MIQTCFHIYFNPVYVYVKRVVLLAVANDYCIVKYSAVMAYVVQLVSYFFKLDIFGVSNFLLLLVITTVLLDAYYGVKKSVKKSKESLAESLMYEVDTPDYRRCLKIAELQKFSPKKLQFTFFKCITLLAYLYVAKNLLETESDGGTIASIIGFASGVATKAPLVIFWYYDFKSIGDNSAYVYEKKAPIFTIVEKIFEPKINSLFNDTKTE